MAPLEQGHNTYIHAEKYVSLALAMLERDTVLPNIVTRFDGGAFRGAKDDTVNYRLPGITKARDYEWRTRTAGIEVDEIYRTKLSISIGTHVYSANHITDEELTLDIENFSAEVLEPQLTAVRERLESKVVAALAAAPFKKTDLDATGSGATPTDPYRFALGAKSALDAQGTPHANRVLLVGTNVEPWLLDSDKLIRMDPPATLSAFREAALYRMAGFTILSNQLIGANAIYALHPSWAVLANVAPEIPTGVVYGARRNYRGYSVRVIRDYDPNFLRDRSVISTFTGINSVNDEYDRYITADPRLADAPATYGVGDIVVNADGEPVFTGDNVRGAKGTFTP